jgi:hypothetical protein
VAGEPDPDLRPICEAGLNGWNRQAGPCAFSLSAIGQIAWEASGTASTEARSPTVFEDRLASR